MYEKEKHQAKIIRDRLKKEGFGYDKVSVRTIWGSYHHLLVFVDVTVKDETVDIGHIEEIIGKYNFVTFDAYSKDAIKGYKTFFDVCWKYSVWRKLQRLRNKSSKKS